MASQREKAIREIIQAFRKILDVIDQISVELKKKHDITGQQAGTLRVIAEKGPISLTEVSVRTFRHITTTGGIVDRLERDGFVIKRQDMNDRRKVLIEATPKGKKLAVSISSKGPLRAMTVLEKLPNKELMKISEAMQIILRILGEEIEESKPDIAVGTIARLIKR